MREELFNKEYPELGYSIYIDFTNNQFLLELRDLNNILLREESYLEDCDIANDILDEIKLFDERLWDLSYNDVTEIFKRLI